MANKVVEENRNIMQLPLSEGLEVTRHLISTMEPDECPPIMLIGPTGCGKTEGLIQVAQTVNAKGWKRTGLKMAIRHLSQVHPLDMGGVGLDTKERSMYFAAPPLYNELKELGEDEPKLAFLDEYDRCQPITQSSTLQFLLSREINGFKAKNTYVVCAANAWHAQYTIELDKAAASRMVIMHVEPRVDDWMLWAAKAAVHPAILVTLSQIPDLLNQGGGFSRSSSDTDGCLKVADPRSWKKLSDAMKAGLDVDYAAAFVGQHAAKQLKIYENVTQSFAKQIKQVLAGKEVSFDEPITEKAQKQRTLFAIYLAAAGQIKKGEGKDTMRIPREFLVNGIEQIGHERTYIASRLIIYNIPAVEMCKDPEIQRIHVEIFKATVGE